MLPEKIRELLRDLLTSRYTELRRRIEYRLGSAEQADDALHETWLRVDSMDMGKIGIIKHPASYLVQMAVNISIDQHRRKMRLLSDTEIDELVTIADSTTDPVRILAGNQEILALERAMDGLTYRRRSILLAARVDGMLHRDIAARFGISERMVVKELSAALAHCSQQLEREVLAQRGAANKKISDDGQNEFE